MASLTKISDPFGSACEIYFPWCIAPYPILEYGKIHVSEFIIMTY